MNKTKKMATFFIWLGLVGGVMVVVSLAGYRIYSGRLNNKIEQNASIERKLISSKIVESANQLNEKTNESTSKIEGKIDSVAAKFSDQLKKGDENLINLLGQQSEEYKAQQKEILSELQKQQEKEENVKSIRASFFNHRDKLKYYIENLSEDMCESIKVTQRIYHIDLLCKERQTNPNLDHDDFYSQEGELIEYVNSKMRHGPRDLLPPEYALKDINSRFLISIRLTCKECLDSVYYVQIDLSKKEYLYLEIDKQDLAITRKIETHIVCDKFDKALSNLYPKGKVKSIDII